MQEKCTALFRKFPQLKSQSNNIFKKRNLFWPKCKFNCLQTKFDKAVAATFWEVHSRHSGIDFQHSWIWHSEIVYRLLCFHSRRLEAKSQFIMLFVIHSKSGGRNNFNHNRLDSVEILYQVQHKLKIGDRINEKIIV